MVVFLASTCMCVCVGGGGYLPGGGGVRGLAGGGGILTWGRWC